MVKRLSQNKMKRSFLVFYFVLIWLCCLAEGNVPVYVTPEDFGCVSNTPKLASNNAVSIR